MLDHMEKELRKELLEQYSATKGNNLLFSEHSFIPFLKHMKNISTFIALRSKIEKRFQSKKDMNSYGRSLNRFVKMRALRGKKTFFIILFIFRPVLR